MYIDSTIHKPYKKNGCELFVKTDTRFPAQEKMGESVFELTGFIKTDLAILLLWSSDGVRRSAGCPRENSARRYPDPDFQRAAQPG